MTTNTNAQPKLVTEAINYNEIILVDAYEVFPEVIEADSGMKVKMRKHRHPDCQGSNPDYIPSEDVFRIAMAWWMAPEQPKPLGLVGETGTGKTELLLYIADRLNEPVYMEKITTGLTGERFEGGYDLITDQGGNNVTKKRYSQAATGYINGGLVILDEVDKANDDLGTSLHLFVEGKPWNLSVFGEVANKHPLCRIAATANTTGAGGHERYITSQRMDMALRSRFGWLTVSYPSSSVEMEIISIKYPKLPYQLRLKMVKTANAFRDALLGPNRDGEIDDPIGCVFSTRVLVHWGYYLMAFGVKRSPMDSLEFTFFGSVDDEDMPLVKGILQRVWGDEITNTLSSILQKDAQQKK